MLMRLRVEDAVCRNYYNRIAIKKYCSKAECGTSVAHIFTFLEPSQGSKEPKDKCRNRLDYRTCGKAAMKGKCSRNWWQFFCMATCKRCCGNIWGDKRCDRLKFLCKKKRKSGAEVRKKCRKACGTCK